MIATLDTALTQNDDLLERYFNDLDAFHEGFLTKESLLVALKRKGLDLDT